MALLIQVAGGTGAGRKTQKQPREWTHACPAWKSRDDAGHYTLTSYSCPDCGARRPA